MMMTVKALLTIRAAAIGQNPQPVNLALEEGTSGKVPSPDFVDALREGLSMAVAAASLGDMAEVRITVMPANLPSMN